jgi:hypothetical protein
MLKPMFCYVLLALLCAGCNSYEKSALIANDEVFEIAQKAAAAYGGTVSLLEKGYRSIPQAAGGSRKWDLVITSADQVGAIQDQIELDFKAYVEASGATITQYFGEAGRDGRKPFNYSYLTKHAAGEVIGMRLATGEADKGRLLVFIHEFSRK